MALKNKDARSAYNKAYWVKNREQMRRNNLAARIRSQTPEHWGLHIVRQLRYRAKLAQLPFDLTPDDIVIPAVCPVLGIELRLGGAKTDPHRPSIDRFDNSKGYTRDNIRVISLRANSLKKDANPSEVRKLLAYVEGKC